MRCYALLGARKAKELCMSSNGASERGSLEVLLLDGLEDVSIGLMAMSL